MGKEAFGPGRQGREGAMPEHRPPAQARLRPTGFFRRWLLAVAGRKRKGLNNVHLIVTLSLLAKLSHVDIVCRSPGPRRATR